MSERGSDWQMAVNASDKLVNLTKRWTSDKQSLSASPVGLAISEAIVGV